MGLRASLRYELQYFALQLEPGVRLVDEPGCLTPVRAAPSLGPRSSAGSPCRGPTCASPASHLSAAYSCCRRRSRLQRNRVAPRASRACNTCNSHRSARSKSLQRNAGSAVRSATSRNSAAFSRHHVAGDTSVSVIMTVCPLSVARGVVDCRRMRFMSAPRCLGPGGSARSPLRRWGYRVSRPLTPVAMTVCQRYRHHRTISRGYAKSIL
jgi:hypothetical protein